MLFSFCFLFFLQCDLLAQVQYMLSEGSTVYHPLLASLLVTFILGTIGLFISRLLSWLPLRMKASAWFLPFLLVGVLTRWHFPQFGDVSGAAGWAPVIVLLLLYFVWVFVLQLFFDSSKENATLSTYLWPNMVQLIAFTMICVGLSNTDIVLHRTLKAVRLIEEQNYEEVLQAARHERHPSRQLSAATALALSNTGQLGEALFAYPQPYGSEGLLPTLADTSLFVNLPLAVGHHLGYKKGDRTSATFFLEVIDTMPRRRPAVRDYLLCAHLLDKKLDCFVERLQTDSLSVSSLPRHYREALLLVPDALPHAPCPMPDDSLKAAFDQFRSILSNGQSRDEREFLAQQQFGTTYWYYYYFGKR